jgi:hypothetical protein
MEYFKPLRRQALRLAQSLRISRGRKGERQGDDSRTFPHS